MSLRLVIKKTVGGAPFSVNVEPDITISDLKAEVSTQAAIPAEEQRLIYKGQVRFLDDMHSTVSLISCGIVSLTICELWCRSSRMTRR